MILADPANFLCDLIDARVGSLEASALPDQWDAAIGFLSNIGAVNERGTPFSPDMPRLRR
jgi:hypothetical protein